MVRLGFRLDIKAAYPLSNFDLKEAVLIANLHVDSGVAVIFELEVLFDKNKTCLFLPCLLCKHHF